jgi:hypothetical protein
MAHIVIPNEARNLLFSYGLGPSQLRFGKMLGMECGEPPLFIL